METVEVIIKIQKDLYDTLKANKVGTLPKDSRLASIFVALISLGTVLPKGHGALKDVDKIVMESSVDMWTDDGYELMIAVEDINNSPTVIEADREVQDEK